MNSMFFKAAIHEYELSYTPDGFAIGTMTLAAEGEKYPLRVRVKLLGKLAEDHVNIAPGTVVIGTGRISQRELTNKHGKSYRVTDTVLSSLQEVRGAQSVLQEIRNANGDLQDEIHVLPDGYFRFSVAGNVTRDGEQYSDKAPLKFGIAINEWNPAERKEDVTFLDVRWWQPDRAPRDVRKGDAVIIIGCMRVESWEDKKTGERRFADVLDIDHAEFGTRWRGNRNAKKPEPPLDIDDEFPPDEELPF